MIKILKITLFCFIILSSSALSEIIRFGPATYDGEVKKGKAHGIGTFTFKDGSKYEGKFSKGRFHGKGKYTDIEGNVLEGKFKYGKITKKINSRAREVVKLSTVVGKSKYYEVRGTGNLSTRWFEAELKPASSSEVKLSSVRELDIFDVPSVFSDDYGDENKLKEILDAKNAKIEAENSNFGDSSGGGSNTSLSPSTISSSSQTVFVLTEKGQRDQNNASSQVAASEPDSAQKNSTSTSYSSSSSGDDGGGSGGGGLC